MTRTVVGWDIGGANIKAALVTDDGSDVRVVEQPFAIWRDPAALPDVLRGMRTRFGEVAGMALTMTAELADCFETKREGVWFVLDAVRRAFPAVDTRVYGVDQRFHSIEEARLQPLQVAAANWVAGAVLIARSFSDALWLDVGSTTTDIVPIVEGRLATRLATDSSRLAAGELVYTGVLRTPICAIVRWLPFRGRRCRVAAEHFAIAADAHLWLNRIDEAAYACDTPDGRGKTRRDSAGRLARMICADAEMLDDGAITAIAAHVVRVQAATIASGIRSVLRGLGSDALTTAVVTGAGADLAILSANKAGLKVHNLPGIGRAAVRAMPAAAVARLYLDDRGQPSAAAPTTGTRLRA